MKINAVHSRLVETQDLLDMLALFPDCAVYGDFYLFGRPHDDPQQTVINMQHIEDLVEFDSAYKDLLAQPHEGRWIHLNAVQGDFLLKKYYTTVSR